MWDKITHLFGKAEDNLEQAIMEARDEGDVEAEESNMLLSILELGEKQVQEIMTPRTDITCLASETTIQEAARCILDNGHSRIPYIRIPKTISSVSFTQKTCSLIWSAIIIILTTMSIKSCVSLFLFLKPKFPPNSYRNFAQEKPYRHCC